MTDWSRLVEQHGPMVWSTVYRLVSNEADAADCFQNTFVSALERSRLEAVHHWPALLRWLATARALECLRRRYRDSRRSAPMAELRDVRAAEGAETAAGSELAAHLRQALAELDARQAQVFCLACLDGLSYREIAESLGLTTSHVGVLLNRAKAGLRERLRSHAPQPPAEGLSRESKS